MKLTDSYLKKKLLKVLYFFITGFPGNLLFPHYLLKVEKPAPEPSQCHTLVNRFTKQNNKIYYQVMVLRLDKVSIPMFWHATSLKTMFWVILTRSGGQKWQKTKIHQNIFELGHGNKQAWKAISSVYTCNTFKTS